MLLSVPPVGGHYLVDVLAGAVIALLAVGARRSVRP
jgi:membrane-associated phospholipid phosphatase